VLQTSTEASGVPVVESSADGAVTDRRPMRMNQYHPRYKWVALRSARVDQRLDRVDLVARDLPWRRPRPAGSRERQLFALDVMGYLVVTAVVVVPFGRLGDMFGRVRIHNLVFVVFTVTAVASSFEPFHLGAGALWLIGWRVVQGVGGAMSMSCSSAILTDAFPVASAGWRPT
jgi:hypothetical protein